MPQHFLAGHFWCREGGRSSSIFDAGVKRKNYGKDSKNGRHVKSRNALWSSD
jgi:hypothetical protein